MMSIQDKLQTDRDLHRRELADKCKGIVSLPNYKYLLEALQCRLIELVGTNISKETLDGFKMAIDYPAELVSEYEN